MMSALLQRVAPLAPEVIEWRRHLHQFPELSHCEAETSAYVEAALRGMGIESIRTGIGGYGIIVDLDSGKPGRTIGIRADMDALPIEEKTGLPFASQRPGVMHACGHDAHTAMLLGAAKVLHEMAQKGEFAGRVRLIFQPAEEMMDAEGKSGGRRMVEEGIMEGVDAVIGQHVSPLIPAGHYAFLGGPICASSDGFTITVKGKPAHGANPHYGIDAIVIAAHLVTAIQQIVSRRVSPMEGGLISIGKIAGGTAANIIADTVVLEGTLRAQLPEVRELLLKELECICLLAPAFGGEAELKVVEGYPQVINDKPLTTLAEAAVCEALGADKVVVSPIGATMGAEDFAFMSRLVPGTFMRIGVRHSDWEQPKTVHTPDFQIDESTLLPGTVGLIAVAMAYTNSF